MRKSTRKLYIPILACVALASTLRAQVVNAQGVVYPIVQNISPEVRLIKFSPDVAVEQLRGSTALSHLRSVMARRPDAFTNASAQLRAKGFTPTQEVFVERTLNTRLVNGDRGTTSPYSLVQTSSESNAQGEIAFWSYDGPGDTWQGTIYMDVYGYGASTWDGQIDTGSTDYPWVWVYKTWDDGCEVLDAADHCQFRGDLCCQGK